MMQSSQKPSAGDIETQLGKAIEAFGQDKTTANAEHVIGWTQKLKEFPDKRFASLKKQGSDIEKSYTAVMNKRFRIPLQSKIDKDVYQQRIEIALPVAVSFNRPDIVRMLNAELEKQNAPMQLSFDSAPPMHDVEKRAAAQGDDGRHVKPQAPSGLINLHKVCDEAFKNARPGQAFTGLVHIRDDKPEKPHKIYIWPVSPSVGSAGDPTKAYAVLPHENTERTLFGKRGISSKPISHLDKKSGNGRMAHLQMVSLLQKKYPEASIDSKEFVAFTVVKGDGDAVHNRYNFKSASVNGVTFQEPDGKQAAFPPISWQKAIVSSVEQS
jgi:hypothetical protein